MADLTAITRAIAEVPDDLDPVDVPAFLDGCVALHGAPLQVCELAGALAGLALRMQR